MVTAGSQRADRAFRVTPGSAVDLDTIDPGARPIGPDRKADAAADLKRIGAELDTLQEALFAQGVHGGERRVLLVLQGMDTSGKGGVIRHVAGLVNPQGLHIASFKKPTPAELRHHFLWRIKRQVPAPGRIGVFDRSHYEDVLVARVNKLVEPAEWRERYAQINAFEADMVQRHAVTIVKCFLHISTHEQYERLLARLDDPAKRWKYNPDDVDVRGKWNDYQCAYAEAIERCGTEAAPWCVIPSDRKWYRNWAIAALLLATLRDLDPQFPRPDFDVAAERARLEACRVPPPAG